MFESICMAFTLTMSLVALNWCGFKFEISLTNYKNPEFEIDDDDDGEDDSLGNNRIPPHQFSNPDWN